MAEDRVERSSLETIGSFAFWLVEGIGATLGWLVGAFAISMAALQVVHGAVLGRVFLTAVIALAVVGVTIWRRRLKCWSVGIGIPLGLLAALGFAGYATAFWFNDKGGAFRVCAGSTVLSTMLGAGCLAYQREIALQRLREWINGLSHSSGCLDQGLFPLFWFVHLSFAVFAAAEPAAIPRMMEAYAQRHDALQRAKDASYVAPVHAAAPSLLSIRGLALAATAILAASFYVSLRRRGKGSVIRGMWVWLLALGQLTGFILAPFALVIAIDSAFESVLKSPGQGWIDLAIGVIAGLIGFGCYRARRRWVISYPRLLPIDASGSSR